MPAAVKGQILNGNSNFVNISIKTINTIVEMTLTINHLITWCYYLYNINQIRTINFSFTNNSLIMQLSPRMYQL